MAEAVLGADDVGAAAFDSGAGVGALGRRGVEDAAGFDLVADDDAAFVEALEDLEVELGLDESPVGGLGLCDCADEVAFEGGDGVAFGVSCEADLGHVDVGAEVAEERLVEAEGPGGFVGGVGLLAEAWGVDVGAVEVLRQGDGAAGGDGASEAELGGDGLALIERCAAGDVALGGADARLIDVVELGGAEEDGVEGGLGGDDLRLGDGGLQACKLEAEVVLNGVADGGLEGELGDLLGLAQEAWAEECGGGGLVGALGVGLRAGHALELWEQSWLDLEAFEAVLAGGGLACGELLGFACFAADAVEDGAFEVSLGLDGEGRGAAGERPGGDAQGEADASGDDGRVRGRVKRWHGLRSGHEEGR